MNLLGNQVSGLKVSETDTKAVLTSKTNEVISIASGVGAQLIVYEGDSSAQTKDSKESLLESIDTVINQCDITNNYLKSFNAAEKYVNKKENIMSLISSLKTNMKDLKKAINNDNLNSIKNIHTEYTNIIVRLQTASL